MNSLIYTEWDLANLQPSYRGDLTRYYLIYWDYNYFCSQILLTSDGTKISHQGILYDVRLLAHEDFNKFRASKRVCLSFRAWTPKEGEESKGVVLVKRAS